MNVGLNDLHPAVGDVLKARVWQMSMDHQSKPEDAASRRLLAKRSKKVGWRIAAALPISALLGAGIGLLCGGHGEEIGIASGVTAYFGTLATVIGSVTAAKGSRNKSVAAEELRCLSQGVELGWSGKVYLDTVCALMEAGGQVADDVGLSILRAAGDLLEQARYVGVRLERLRAAASASSVADLEVERDRLAERAAQAVDPQARSDLSQSLSMCEERLRNARTLEPLIERLDAQREVIHQTLLSVQSSVSRLQVAPAALAAPDVEEVQRVLDQVTAQTKAVEDAVQEVMSLRA
jgi:hypothetical protein